MKKKFYEELRIITDIIEEMKLSEILLNAAKGKDVKQMEEFLEDYKKNNESDIWERIEAIGEKYTTIMARNNIFYTEEAVQDTEDYEAYMDDGLVLYKPEEIKPINLCMLMALSDGSIDDDDLFVKYSQFTDYVVRDGYPLLANFIKQRYFNSVEALTEFVNQT